MNGLAEKFGADKLQILAFPCNQFGKQENISGDEILRSLEHVRPGNGYKPKFPVMQKGDVNGANSQPLFKLLRHAQPMPSDRTFADQEDNPIGAFKDSSRLIWSPVTGTDISWNFGKCM